MATEQFIKSYFSDLSKVLRHHNEVLSVVNDLSLNSYLNIKEIVFGVEKVFSFIDGTFEESLMGKLYNDIVNLTFFFDSLHYDDRVDEIYDEYIKDESTKVKENKEKFQEEFLKEFKKHKLRIIALVNTKLYYFDLLIWDKAKSSKEIVNFLRTNKLINIYNTQQYIKKSDKFGKSKINFTYKQIEDNLFTQYSSEELSYLKSLTDHEECLEDVDKNLQTLINAKQNINFFKNMDDEDIKYVVEDVKFIQYRMHETIVKEGEITQEIYYLLSGECRVISDKKVVGNIKKGQVFGEFSSINKKPRNATIKTNEPSTAISFKIAFEHFENEPHLFSILYRNIVNELIKKIDTVNKKKF